MSTSPRCTIDLEDEFEVWQVLPKWYHDQKTQTTNYNAPWWMQGVKHTVKIFGILIGLLSSENCLELVG